MRERLFVRLLAGLLAVALVPAIVLAALLTNSAASSIEDAATEGLTKAATGTAARVDDWIGERRSDLRVLADELEAADAERDPGRARPLVVATARDTRGYLSFSLTDLRGRRLAGTAGAAGAEVGREPFFERAAGGESSISRLEVTGGGTRWFAGQPVRDDRGRVVAVIVGRLDAGRLNSFLSRQRFGDTGEALLRDGDGRLVAKARAREGVDQTELRLGTRAISEAVQRALVGRSGALRYVDPRGVDVIGGYAPVRRLGWAAVVKQDEEEAFADVGEERRLALLLVLLTAAVAVAFALLFASRITRPIRELAAAAAEIARGDLTRRVQPAGSVEIKELSESFNSMLDSVERLVGRLRAASTQMSASAVELSTASDELAATTNEQNAAATETGTTMEELATTSASIAENIEAIAEQTSDTQRALATADEGIQSSSERTLALARRVDEIGAILELIDEIADRTSLLALNAAIEAARAGESGSGFTVVADEVRKLAERSKQSSAEIAAIVQGTQAETNATVMAMEAGSKQMRLGLDLMNAVATATDQARLTTEQQRAASVQVVEAMQSVTAASRQTSATAQQIAEAASGLTDVAADLEATAASASVRAADEDGATTPPAPPPGDGAGHESDRPLPVGQGHSGRG